MGLFDRMKKKFEDAGSDKKVENVVDEKKKKKEKKSEKKEKKSGLTSEEIKRAQSMETGAPQADTEKAKEKKKEKKEPRDTKDAYKVLVKPVFTEKATYLSSSNSYVFEVHPSVSKSEVRKAVFAVYNVLPVSVRMITVKGKDITFGRISGTTKNWKKAIVTLPEGKTIDVYQN